MEEETLVAPRTPRSQAQRIIAKFGGVRKLQEALHAIAPEKFKTTDIVYRWTHPKSKRGTGGLIPNGAIPYVEAAAKVEGIELTESDWYPGEKC